MLANEHCKHRYWVDDYSIHEHVAFGIVQVIYKVRLYLKLKYVSMFERHNGNYWTCIYALYIARAACFIIYCYKPLFVGPDTQ